MIHWVQTHGIESLIIFWVFSAAVSSMPNPKEGEQGFYAWLYRFTHELLQFAAGAINRIPAVRAVLQTPKQNAEEDAKLIDPPDRKDAA